MNFRRSFVQPLSLSSHPLDSSPGRGASGETGCFVGTAKASPTRTEVALRSNDEEVVKRKTVSLKNRLPSAEDDEGRTAGALGQQLRSGVEGGTGAERSGDGSSI